jgi:hypothetical protein
MEEISSARNITKGTLEDEGMHKKYTQSAEFFSRLQVSACLHKLRGVHGIHGPVHGVHCSVHGMVFIVPCMTLAHFSDRRMYKKTSKRWDPQRTEELADELERRPRGCALAASARCRYETGHMQRAAPPAPDRARRSGQSSLRFWCTGFCLLSWPKTHNVRRPSIVI